MRPGTLHGPFPELWLWELRIGTGQNLKAPCQGMGLTLTFFYKNVVSPPTPQHLGPRQPGDGWDCAVPPPPSLGAPRSCPAALGSTLVWTMPGRWSLRCSRVAAMSISLAPGRKQWAGFRWDSPGDRQPSAASRPWPRAGRSLWSPCSPSAGRCCVRVPRTWLAASSPGIEGPGLKNATHASHRHRYGCNLTRIPSHRSDMQAPFPGVQISYAEK